jgi:hypothetical protein
MYFSLRRWIHGKKALNVLKEKEKEKANVTAVVMVLDWSCY